MLYWVQSSKLSHMPGYNLKKESILLIFTWFYKKIPYLFLYTFNVIFSIIVYVIFLYPK